VGSDSFKSENVTIF